MSGTVPGTMEGRVCVISGGGAGIGRATALRLAREGATVVASDIREEAARETVALVEEAGGQGHAAAIDVTEEEQWLALVERVHREAGGIDALFNNAGGGSGVDGPVTEMDLNEFWRAIRVDLFGTVLGCRTVIPAMVQRGGGSIVNISSLRATIGTRGQDAYTAAKGGVLALSRAMAVEWADRNIRVNVMAPGVIKTERVMKMLGPNHPLSAKMLTGPLEVSSVANMAYYLLSDESIGVTGAVMRLDGGASAH